MTMSSAVTVKEAATEPQKVRVSKAGETETSLGNP